MTLSVQHFFGKDLSGPLTKINLPALGSDFKVPVFIIQGEDDLRASPDLAREYFDSIQARLRSNSSSCREQAMSHPVN